jgi:hypothetical protein
MLSHEALKAMSTLILAADKHSDLLELQGLKHVFTERYEPPIEPFGKL